MTPVDLVAAEDSIKAQFNAAWKALSPAVVASTSPVRVEWDGLDDGTKRDATKPYAAFFLKHLDAGQATFGARSGGRRFSRSGLITVQVFEPLLNRTGLSIVGKLAIIARDAFEGQSTADGIWFQNTKIKTIGNDGKGWYQVNVLATFTFDELK